MAFQPWGFLVRIGILVSAIVTLWSWFFASGNHYQTAANDYSPYQKPYLLPTYLRYLSSYNGLVSTRSLDIYLLVGLVLCASPSTKLFLFGQSPL